MATGNSSDKLARLREVDLNESANSASASEPSKPARRGGPDRSDFDYGPEGPTHETMADLIEIAARSSQGVPEQTPKEPPQKPTQRKWPPEDSDSDLDSDSDSDASEPKKPPRRVKPESPLSREQRFGMVLRAARASRGLPEQAPRYDIDFGPEGPTPEQMRDLVARIERDLQPPPRKAPEEPALNENRGLDSKSKPDSDFGSGCGCSGSGCSKPPQRAHSGREDSPAASGTEAEGEVTQEPEPQRPEEPALEDQEPPSPLRYRPFAPYEAAGANIPPPAYVDQQDDDTGAHDFVMPDGWMSPTRMPTAAELNRDLMARRDGWVWVPTEIAPAYRAPVPPMYPARGPEFVPVENHHGDRFVHVSPPFPAHAPDFVQDEEPPVYRGDPFAPIPPPFPVRAPDAFPPGHGSPFASVPPSSPLSGSDFFTGGISPVHRQSHSFAPVPPLFPTRGPDFMAPRRGPYSPIVRFFMPTSEFGPSSFQRPLRSYQPPAHFQPPLSTPGAYRASRPADSEPPRSYREAMRRQEEELEQAWREYDEQCIGNSGQGQRQSGNTGQPLVAETGSPSSGRTQTLPHRPRR